MALHYRYWLGILIALLIGALTTEWGDNAELVGYLNFGMAFSSITLAVVAMVYAFVSNIATFRIMSDLEAASHSIKTSSGELVATASNLAQQFDSIPPLITGVGAKVDTAHELLADLRARGERREVDVQLEMQQSPIDKLLAESSNSGLEILYAFALAHRTGTPIDLKKLTTPLPFVEESYAHGFIVAATALGMLDYELTDNMYVVTKYQEDLNARIDKALRQRLESATGLAAKVGGQQFASINSYFAPSVDTGDVGVE